MEELNNQTMKEIEPTGNNQEEKTFTQEEVNEIVQKRLARVKNGLDEQDDNLIIKEQELVQKEQELALREMKFNAKEVLKDKGLPIELLDVISYTDTETINKSIEVFEGVFNKIKEDYKPINVSGLVPAGYVPSNSKQTSYGDWEHDDKIRKNMGIKNINKEKE